MSADPNVMQAQLDALSRRRAMAEQMAQQLSEPQQQQVVNGRVMDQGFAPAIRGIASLLSQGRAASADRQATQLQSQLGQARQAQADKALQALLAGPPEQPQEMTITALPPTMKPDPFLNGLSRANTALRGGVPSPIVEAYLKQNSVENKPDAPKPLQHTAEGLMFDGSHYLDPDGKIMSSKDVQTWRTKMAGDRATAVASAKPTNSSALLPPETIELEAQNYLKTGKLPPLYRDNDTKRVIMNRAAQIAKENGNDAAAAVIDRQSFAANKGALSKVTAQKNMVGSFEKTFQKNLDLAMNLSGKVDRTGSPLINKAIQHWRTGISGDPETKGFINALTTAKDEYAKILSGATGAAGITDAARAESDKLFSTVDSPETLAYVAEVAKQEAHNRMTSFDEQLKEITGSMGNKPSQETAADRAKRLGL